MYFLETRHSRHWTRTRDENIIIYVSRHSEYPGRGKWMAMYREGRNFWEVIFEVLCKVSRIFLVKLKKHTVHVFGEARFDSKRNTEPEVRVMKLEKSTGTSKRSSLCWWGIFTSYRQMKEIANAGLESGRKTELKTWVWESSQTTETNFNQRVSQ